MSDLRVFRVEGQTVKAVEAKTLTLEKSLQTLIESNLEEMLGIRFLASEHFTGAKHGGRIDTLGLDENNCPVIIEFKRAVSENVINQGLFYLDWLNDHHADFRWLVMEELGKKVAESIDWSGTRLVCIAGDFTKYDLHAIQQIPQNIELLRFAYSAEMCLFWRWREAISKRTCRRHPRTHRRQRSRPICRNHHRCCWKKRPSLFGTHTMLLRLKP